MKIAYLMFAYKNPRLLERLIGALSCEDSAFFVHIDAKQDLRPFAAVRGPQVRFTERRIRVHWAEFSGVEAILLLMREALEAPERYDYLALLSGSEYPLQPRRYVHDFLREHRGTEYINLVKVPNEAAGKPLARITTMRARSERPVLRLVTRILARLSLATRDHRRHLGSLEPYAGNTWWTLTREACRYVLDFTRLHPAVVRYFEHTFVPEEVYIHTILGNSPFRSRIRRNLLYEDWSGRGAHPEMLRRDHMAFFRRHATVQLDDVYGRGEVLFARKFSDDRLDLVDEMDRLLEFRELTGRRTARADHAEAGSGVAGRS